MVTVKPAVSLGRTVMPPPLGLGAALLLNLLRGMEVGPGV